MDDRLPRWLDVGVIPLLNLAIAFLFAGLAVLLIGLNPLAAAAVMFEGAFLDPYGIGYTLYFATSYIFTGLAVAVAFHAAMFNIGGEGQALIAGLGVGFVALALDWTSWYVTFPVAILASMAFGAFWAAIPAYMQAYRGSHIVITTIMMNFIAAAIVNYLIVYVLRDNVVGANETRRFLEGAWLPRAADFLGIFGIEYRPSIPLNITFFLAIFACFAVYYLIWKMRFGYEIRAFGFSETSAKYAGISMTKIVIVAMLISGALAGLMANNTVLGEAKKLGLDPVTGAGFMGIAVALLGRNHPFGVFLAAILFGALVQGGAELSFEFQGVSRDFVLVIQGLVILFVGALDNLTRIPITRAWRRHVMQKQVEP